MTPAPTPIQTHNVQTAHHRPLIHTSHQNHHQQQQQPRQSHQHQLILPKMPVDNSNKQIQTSTGTTLTEVCKINILMKITKISSSFSLQQVGLSHLITLSLEQIYQIGTTSTKAIIWDNLSIKEWVCKRFTVIYLV